MIQNLINNANEAYVFGYGFAVGATAALVVNFVFALTGKVV